MRQVFPDHSHLARGMVRYSEQAEKAPFSAEGLIFSSDEVLRVTVHGVGSKKVLSL